MAVRPNPSLQPTAASKPAAVGAVLAKDMYDLMKEGAPVGDPNEAYWSELRQLRAKE